MNRIIPTCETAVSTLPEWHRAAFEHCPDRVTSVEGWSPGAYNLAQGVAARVQAQLLHNSVNRLLIDLARAPDDPARWSDIALTFTDEQRQRLDDREKAPFLEAIENQIRGALRQGQQPVHLSFDTRPDLGGDWMLIEHDAFRGTEARFATELADTLRQRLPQVGLRIDASTGNGMSGWLRSRHPELLSLRITVIQSAFLDGRPAAWKPFKQAVIDAVVSIA
jgi:predicted N-formylglutamate amidohydrolase